MSAKWIRVETDFVDHPKTFRLAAELGEPLAEAYVLRAWTFLSRFCPTGHVRDIDGTALEAACRWRGEAGKLLAAFVRTEWLEALPEGGWEAHDWADHQGKVAQRAEKERERKRAYRERKAAEASASVPSLSRGTSAGRPDQRDVTGRDVTGRDVEKQHVPVPALDLQVQTPAPDVAALRAVWNETTTAPLSRWHSGREELARAALKRRTLEQWREVFARINASAFCRGQDGGWRADIDWALRPEGKKPETALKVLEGAFDRAAGPSKGPVAAESVDWTTAQFGEVPL